MRTMYNDDVHNNNDDNNVWKYKYDDFKNMSIMILKDINIIILIRIFKTINEKTIITIF